MLQSCIDCDTIETNGTHLSVETLRLIEQAAKTRGVIIFTDPDHPGETIRTAINQKIPGCKNAYIEKHKAKTAKKVGVEHASKKICWMHYLMYSPIKNSLLKVYPGKNIYLWACMGGKLPLIKEKKLLRRFI